MNEFWRQSKFQHFQNVLHTKQITIVIFSVILLNQIFLPTNAAVVVSKREIITNNDGFTNVINATTEHPNLFDEKHVINITNKISTTPHESTNEQYDNKIPKESGSHELDEEQIELVGSAEQSIKRAEEQAATSTLRSTNVTANRRIDEDVKDDSTSSTISSSFSSISENTKDTSHIVVDHRLPLQNSLNSTSTTTTTPTIATTGPIEKVPSIVTPSPSIQSITTATSSPLTTAPSITAATRTTLHITSEDILKLSSSTTESSPTTQNISPGFVLPLSITTELNQFTKLLKTKPSSRSEQSSELNHTSGQSTNNNQNNIKDEKSNNNNSESRANIQFQKNADPIRNQSTSNEPLPNPEIVTEKRAKYLVDHSASAILTTLNPLGETWSSLKTVGEVNHNNVSFARVNEPDESIKTLAEWAEITQENEDANNTLLSVPNTTQKEVQETTPNLDLKINSSRIDETGHQDNHLTSEHITTTPTPLSTARSNIKVNTTTERGIMSMTTQKNAKIQDIKPNLTNAITSTTMRNAATKLALPKVTYIEETTEEPVITTTDKVEETTLLDLATTIKPPIISTEVIVTEKINKSHTQITAKEVPSAVHTTAKPLLLETTSEGRHREETTTFTEFFTTSTTLGETTTDTNDIPMLPTQRVPAYQKPTEKLINFDSSLEKDVTNKQIPITTEKETIHISPSAQPTTTEPVHKSSTLGPIHHEPSSTQSDIAPFDKINPSNPNKDNDNGRIHNDSESTTVAEVSPEIPEGLGDEYLKEETDYNTIIALSVSCIGLIALILLIAFLIIMRKRQKQLTYGQRCRPVGLDAYSLDNISVYNSVRRKSVLRSSKRAYGNAAFDDPGLKNNLLTVSQLAAFVKKRTAIFDEFKDVPLVTARIDEVPAGCEDKNRYANIVPLPESRVHLKRIGDEEKTEYINANFVKGPKDTTHYYIACQAPLENTIIDFWRMIWEQNSRVIIMATDLTENGIEKCAEYLPPSFVIDNHVVFGDYQITLKNREVHEKYAVSMCHLKNLVTNTWREITHFWYQWPENGVPTEEASVIAMLLEARSYLKMVTAEQTNGDLQESSNNDLKTGNGNLDKNKSLQKVQGPLTVHCSPGTGRTGTVIACDIALRSLEQPSRSVDIPQIVYCVRRGRASAVQTREQYEFIYKVAHMYATKLMGPISDN